MTESKIEEIVEEPVAVPPKADEKSQEVDDGKHTKTERKAKKAFVKLGLKPVDGYSRVTIKKGKNTLFVINQPEVYKSEPSNTFVIFGEIKVEDLSGMAQMSAAQKFRKNEIANAQAAAAAGNAPSSAPEKAEEGSEEPVDESGLESKDIEIVMQQANASRAKAVKALKKSNNDIVTAIMELTM
eukprot:CAMPEP_0197008754 /NCGR_PEP_ID=MMETSP1380-20130617/46758_1 /TAXON_ID=5936 /ORGANISM="Euplotes crassus, Strain CT5" /LENGTH=183 /DNA_ID=CAMNT_0042429543 /DNA_START=49 /DNA_END=600 /DNA_ORIENTATION=-